MRQGRGWNVAEPRRLRPVVGRPSWWAARPCQVGGRRRRRRRRCPRAPHPPPLHLLQCRQPERHCLVQVPGGAAACTTAAACAGSAAAAAAAGTSATLGSQENLKHRAAAGPTGAKRRPQWLPPEHIQLLHLELCNVAGPEHTACPPGHSISRQGTGTQSGTVHCMLRGDAAPTLCSGQLIQPSQTTQAGACRKQHAHLTHAHSCHPVQSAAKHVAEQAGCAHLLYSGVMCSRWPTGSSSACPAHQPARPDSPASRSCAASA